MRGSFVGHRFCTANNLGAAGMGYRVAERFGST